MTPHKAKLREQLAQAHDAWLNTKDDQEGWTQRRRAVQMALGAFLEWTRAEFPRPSTYRPSI